MNKIILVFQREYLTRVRKKSFLYTTILVPLIILGFYAAIIAVSISGSSKSQKIAVIDEAGLFNGKIEPDVKNNQLFVLISGESEQAFKKKYQDEGYTSFLYIPKMNFQEPAGVKLHSKTAVGLMDKNRIERTVDRAIEAKRLGISNIDPAKYEAIKSDISIDNTIDSKTGEKKSIAGLAYGISFAGGMLIYIILMIYGMMVMRGVMEEKVNRIAEVIVSSLKPFQLMLGKILGIGAVGITQFAIWLILIGILQMVFPLIFPGYFQHSSAAAGTVQSAPSNVINTVSEGLKSINISLIITCFILYFIGGYLLYASLFAAVGSVVSEDQQEAQQLVFPILMPIILGFVMMMKAASDPTSNLAIFGSLFPLTSPIVMMGRVTYGVPWWQLVLSLVLLFSTFLLFTWLTGKIYRTAILMYGKKITWKEMVKWAFR